MTAVSPTESSMAVVSHNVLGQRLGRKGQETRGRILAALQRLLDGPPDTPITLSNVARETSVGISTLYLYFPDLGELILAAMGNLLENTKGSFTDILGVRWPDDQLDACCTRFIDSYYRFWCNHGRLMHIRNAFADANDLRFLRLRHQTSTPIIKMMVAQMDGDPEILDQFDTHLAMVLLTGLERLATVMMNPQMSFQMNFDQPGAKIDVEQLIKAEAYLLQVAIRAHRDVIAGGRDAGA